MNRQLLLIPDVEYHAHESVTFSSDMDTPLGCKRCGELMRHPLHGLPAPMSHTRTELATYGPPREVSP